MLSILLAQPTAVEVSLQGTFQGTPVNMQLVWLFTMTAIALLPVAVHGKLFT